MSKAADNPSATAEAADHMAPAWAVRREDVREPSLSETVVAVRAPALAISGWDGQIRARARNADNREFPTAHGYYHQDRRILSQSELTVDGASPEYAGHSLLGATQSKHVGILRTTLDPTPDPVLKVERIHRAGLGERIVIFNSGAMTRVLNVRLRVAADLADISDVRRGQPDGYVSVEEQHEGSLRWTDKADGTIVGLEAKPIPRIDDIHDTSAVLHWRAELPAGSHWEVELNLNTVSAPAVGHPLVQADVEHPWSRPAPTGDLRLDAVLAQGFDDLQALLLAPADSPSQAFVAAGAPWYLTLFGRDSLWTARLLLPVDSDCDLAYGTLRVLADLQGVKDDPETDEQPGKILHELRCRQTRHQQGEILPPVYYGSMDATPLFVVLLVEAWLAGMSRERVGSLIEPARAALRWLRERSNADDARLIRYEALHAGALFNHGWKDSVDAIVDAHGVPAERPLALSEVQAYSIHAALGFAELLEDFEGRDTAKDEATQLRDWGHDLLGRFTKHFTVADDEGREPYFAIALDRDDQVVNGLSSNIGHLLGTRILDSKQSVQVARHLLSDELFSGWGLRTRSSAHQRFNPLSYHGGAVWAHDTAIAIRGLALAACEAAEAGDRKAAEECAAASRQIGDSLLAAAWALRNRLPELFSGDARDLDDEAGPVAFPFACRPQAWAAAAGIAVWAARERLKVLDEDRDSS